jgi:hypothetical protein
MHLSPIRPYSIYIHKFPISPLLHPLFLLATHGFSVVVFVPSLNSLSPFTWANNFCRYNYTISVDPRPSNSPALLHLSFHLCKYSKLAHRHQRQQPVLPSWRRARLGMLDFRLRMKRWDNLSFAWCTGIR